MFAKSVGFLEKFYTKNKIIFLPDLKTSHYAKKILECLETNNTSYVCKNANPSNIHIYVYNIPSNMYIVLLLVPFGMYGLSEIYGQYPLKTFTKIQSAS